MKNIIKNLKPYWKSVIVILLLLVVQAACDLTLPQYTSRIIDTGIQNSGIEHILPEKITAEEFAQAQLFMTEEEAKAFTACYREEGELYVLAETDSEALSAMDETLLMPIVLTYQLGHVTEDQFKAMTGMELAQAEAAGMPVTTFTAENEAGEEITYVDLRTALAAMIESGQMDGAMVSRAREQLEKTVDTIGTDTLVSMGIAYAAECDEAAGIDLAEKQTGYLWSTGARMLGLTGILLIVSITISYIASRVGAGVGRDLRLKVYRNVISFSNAEMDRFSTASLITRSTNDVQQIQIVCVILLRMVMFAPIMGVGGIIKVAQTGAGMSWLIALAVVSIICVLGGLVLIAMPKFRKMQVLVDRINLVARELLTGLSVIRAFGREKTEQKRFDEANLALKRNQLFTNRVMTFMMPMMMMMMNLLVVAVMWVGAGRIDTGDLKVGALTAFITYAMHIVMSFLILSAMSILLPRAGVAADRIEEVISSKPSVLDPEQPKALPEGGAQGVLAFRDVSFRYPGAEEDVVSGISFVAEPGKTTAIIGSTGSGKSTIVNLIPRFFDVTGGSITLDGIDIRDLTLHDLRGEIGFVPQKGVLFSGTIESNLRFGAQDASDEAIRAAAEIAQATEFIDDKEKGFASEIAQGGSNVSGGQKQRLAIARAIARDPKIYVFDDSFSALDMKTDAKLRAALAERVKDSAVIIVAQRISTILHADNILVLDEGRIVGAGTHEDLLRNCDTYREIAESQLSAKELGLEEVR